MDSVLDDAQLIQAARKRLLRMLEAEGGGGSPVTNNVYGGGGHGGLTEQMQGADSDPDRDYFVDITREDLPEINPATKKPMGWKKSVHRRSAAKGK